MGIHDRDYVRRKVQRPGLPPVTKWLLILNIAIFLLDLIQRHPPRPGVHVWGPLNNWGRFTFESAVLGGQVWEFLTFQFLHDSIGHVAFNCLAIYIFSPFVERWWGSRRFLAYYLLCGAAGGLFYSLLLLIGLLPNTSFATPLVGASAGVFGLIFAVYRIAPAVQVRLLLPPVTLTMRQLALALAGLAVLIILGGLIFPRARIFWNSGGEAGHLGGALMGLLLMRFPGLLRWPWSSGGKVIRPKEFRRSRPPTAKRGEPKLKPRTMVDTVTTDEVDRILDKANEHGFGSLTEEERRILNQVSKGE